MCTLPSTPLNRCCISHVKSRATSSPKEGSLRPKTWQRAPPLCHCPSKRRWDLCTVAENETWRRRRGTVRDVDGAMTAEGTVPSSALPHKALNKPVCGGCDSPHLSTQLDMVPPTCNRHLNALNMLSSNEVTNEEEVQAVLQLYVTVED